MKKEKLIELLRKAYLSGVMEKELADKMIGFNHDLEGMATNYAEIEVNNVILDDVIKCECENSPIYRDFDTGKALCYDCEKEL